MIRTNFKPWASAPERLFIAKATAKAPTPPPQPPSSSPSPLPSSLSAKERTKGHHQEQSSAAVDWRDLIRWRKSPYDGRIFAVAGPALLTLAADPLLSIVDTIYVGNLGAGELAALGVNTGVFSLAYVVFNFLAVTTTTLVASAVACDDKDRAGQAAVQSFLLSVILGLFVFILLETNIDPILSTMGASPEIMELSKQYLRSRALAAPAALIGLSGQGVFRGLQDTKTPLAITIVANMINFILDPILIYGCHFGVRGAAFATAFAEISSAAAYCGLIWRRRSEIGLDCTFQKAIERARGSYIPFLQSSGTMMFRTSVLIGTKTLATSVATRLGPSCIAAHQVVAQLWLLHSLLSDAIAIAGQSLIASFLAKPNKQRIARKVSNRLLQLGLYLGFLMSIGYMVAYPLLPHIFTNDRSVIDNVYHILPFAIVMLPLNSIAYIFDGVMLGAADYKFLAWSMAASACMAASSLLMVIPYHWGLEGVWASQSSLMVFRFIILTHRYNQSDNPIPPLKKT